MPCDREYTTFADGTSGAIGRIPGQCRRRVQLRDNARNRFICLSLASVFAFSRFRSSREMNETRREEGGGSRRERNKETPLTVLYRRVVNERRGAICFPCGITFAATPQEQRWQRARRSPGHQHRTPMLFRDLRGCSVGCTHDCTPCDSHRA